MSDQPLTYPPRGSRLIAIVCAMVGLGAAVFVWLVAIYGSSSIIMVLGWSGYGENKPITYVVLLFGYEVEKGEVNTPEQLDNVDSHWRLTTLATLGTLCSVLGWHFGRWFSYRVSNFKSRH